MPPPPRGAPPSEAEQRAGLHRPGSVRYRSTRRPPSSASLRGKPRTLSAHAALSSPPSKKSPTVLATTLDVVPGDPYWLRVMETKEDQWRLLNCLALHEAHAQERAVCAEMDALSGRLDAVSARAATLEETVKRCRARRAHQTFRGVAAPQLARLTEAIERAQVPHANTCRALAEAARAVPLKGVALESQAELATELERFREVARRFREKSFEVGIPELKEACDAFEELAKVVGGEEPAAVTCAAVAVSEAVKIVECERAMVAKRVADVRAGSGFDAEPSFVE